MNNAILIGGGWSVREGIDMGLWDRLAGQEIWSCNSVFKAMPYLPHTQLWVDREFFNHEVDTLQRLHDKKVRLITKASIRLAGLRGQIIQYNTSRLKEDYYGRQALYRDVIYYGQMGLCGQFALSVAIAQGYRNIYLLGYDFGAPTLHHKNTHWYQDQIGPLGIYSTGAGRPEVYLHKEPEAAGQPRMDDLSDWDVYKQESDVNIYNVSLVSHLTALPKISYNEFFTKIGV